MGDLTAEEGIVKEEVDLLQLLRRYCDIQKSKGKYHEAVSTDAKLDILFETILISFVDHILFQRQQTSSPNFFMQIFQIDRTSDEWLLKFLAESNINRTNRRTYSKFILQMVDQLESAKALLQTMKVFSINLSTGKSIKRLDTTYQLNFRYLDYQELQNHWECLSNQQRAEFSQSLGRMIIRTFIRINMQCTQRAANPNHDRIFLYLEVSDFQDANLTRNQDNNSKFEVDIWQVFRIESYESFTPLPKTKKIRKRRVVPRQRRKLIKENSVAPPSVAFLDEKVLTAAESIKNSIEREVDSLRDTTSKFLSISIAAQYTDAEEDNCRLHWLIPLKGIRGPNLQGL